MSIALTVVVGFIISGGMKDLSFSFIFITNSSSYFVLKHYNRPRLFRRVFFCVDVPVSEGRMTPSVE